MPSKGRTGQCDRCRKPITADDEYEWFEGTRMVHITCHPNPPPPKAAEPVKQEIKPAAQPAPKPAEVKPAPAGSATGAKPGEAKPAEPSKSVN